MQYHLISQLSIAVLEILPSKTLISGPFSGPMTANHQPTQWPIKWATACGQLEYFKYAIKLPSHANSKAYFIYVFTSASKRQLNLAPLTNFQ
jgi:hypothetical protein